MSRWTRGDDSIVYRFEQRRSGTPNQMVEIEEYDQGGVEVRLFDEPGADISEMSEEARFDSLTEAVNYAREQWGIDADVLPNSPTVRVNRLVLSLLADYVGSDAVFGHDVPAETRDALAAAYEVLDEPGLPLTFHDCPRDGAALEPLPDDPQLPPHIEPLACPECGDEFLLDRETGELNVNG